VAKMTIESGCQYTQVPLSDKMKK